MFHLVRADCILPEDVVHVTEPEDYAVVEAVFVLSNGDVQICGSYGDGSYLDVVCDPSDLFDVNSN